MMLPGFRKANNRAIGGFLLPFLAAGLASLLVLSGEDEFLSPRFWIPFVTIIPLILLLGLFLSIKSISFVEALGDKDYAYSGLILNIFFIILYIISVIYYLIAPSGS